VFRGYLSVEQQVAALLEEAMGVRGMKRFVIVHPQSAFGEGAATTFEAAVLARGGTIVHKQAYAAEQRDFRPVARALWRRDPQTRRPTLLPGTDYDAIFLPERYQATALLAAAMGYEEFAVGTFRARGARSTLLMGLNAWNHPDFSRRGGVYVRGSMFVDAFHADSQDPAVVDFVAAWRAKGAGRPGTLEALGMDLGLLVRSAVAKGGGVEGLRAAQVEAPVAGTTSMGADRQAARHLRVLTITEEGVAPFPPFVEPTPVEGAPTP
jgi:ABC-type branched-subunit amino acid transport system substrate-binding protein